MNNYNEIPVNKNIEEDFLFDSIEDNMSDEKVSCEETSNSHHIQSTEDSEKQIVQQRGDDLEFFDHPQYYIYNKLGQVNSLEDRNSHSFQIDEKKDNPPVIVDGPELVLNKKLHVDSFEQWQHIMLEGCKILIKETKNQESIGVNEPFDVDSAIEIRPVNGNSKEWKMFLRQDPKKCYEKCGEKDRNIYINHAKRVIKEYKQDNSDQLNSSKEDEKKEYTPIQNIDECLKQFEKSTSQCGFYVCKSPYCIEKTDRYYAAVRCTGERVITVSPRDHYNNENWIQQKDTWEDICQLIDYIKRVLNLRQFPIQEICISFGRWTSQGENGLLPDRCHAHINMTLTKQAIKACEGRKDKYAFLQYSIFAPVAYHYLDAIKLLNYIEHPNCPIETSYIYSKTNHFCKSVDHSNSIDCNSYFEQKSYNSDDDEDDASLFNQDGYYSQSLSTSCERYLQISMRAKPSIIHRLTDGKCEKANKIVRNECI